MQPTSASVSRRQHSSLSWLTKLTLLAIPLLASMSRWASISPGAPNSPYFYRLLIPALVLGAVASIIRGYRPYGGEWILISALLLTALWGMELIYEGAYGEGGVAKYLSLLFQIAAAIVIIWVLRADHERLMWFRYGLLLSLLMQVLIGAWEVTTSQHLNDLVGQEWLFSFRDVPVGTFVNPNNYALFVVGTMGPLLAVAALKRRYAWHILAGLGILAIVILCVQTSGVAALTLAGLIGAMWIVFNDFRRLGTVIMAGTLMLAVTAAVTVTHYVNIIDFLFSTVDENQDTSLTSRLDTYAFLLRLARAESYLGIGPGSIADEVVMVSREFQGGILINPHNTWLEMLVEYGVFLALPMFAYLVWIVSTLVRSLGRRAGETARTRYLRVEGMSVVSTIIVANFIASSLIIETTWWMYLGYAGAIGATLRREWHATDAAATDRTPATALGEQTAGPTVDHDLAVPGVAAYQ